MDQSRHVAELTMYKEYDALPEPKVPYSQRAPQVGSFVRA